MASRRHKPKSPSPLVLEQALFFLNENPDGWRAFAEFTLESWLRNRQVAVLWRQSRDSAGVRSPRDEPRAVQEWAAAQRIPTRTDCEQHAPVWSQPWTPVDTTPAYDALKQWDFRHIRCCLGCARFFVVSHGAQRFCTPTARYRYRPPTKRDRAAYMRAYRQTPMVKMRVTTRKKAKTQK